MLNKYQSYRGLRVYMASERSEKEGYTLPEGTAVVSRGYKDDEGKMLCFFEGNIYGASNLRTFESRAICAAGRLVKNYPTIAKGKIPIDCLIEVGVIEIRLRTGRQIPLPPEMRSLPKSVQKRMLPRHLAKQLDPDPELFVRFHPGSTNLLMQYK